MFSIKLRINMEHRSRTSCMQPEMQSLIGDTDQCFWCTTFLSGHLYQAIFITFNVILLIIMLTTIVFQFISFILFLIWYIVCRYLCPAASSCKLSSISDSQGSDCFMTFFHKLTNVEVLEAESA